MKSSPLQKLSIGLLTTTLMTPFAYAAPDDEWGLDLGLVNQKSRYKNSSNNVDVVLDLAYLHHHSDNENLFYEFVIAQENIGYQSKDGQVFKGMTKRKDSIDLGARVVVKTGFAPITFEATRDVRDAEGYQAKIKLGGVTTNSKEGLTVRPSVGIRYQDSKTVDYYYGVRSSEATADRRQYKAGVATTPYLGLEAVANVTRQISVHGDVSYEKIASSIQNSPLTDDKNYDLQAKIGLTYWF